MNNKIEILAPAGCFERLQTAIAFGADAVYMGGTSLGLRAKAKNFEMEQMAAAIKYAHGRGVKVYITANVLAHNEDFAGMEDYFKQLQAIGADALIISDLGVFSIAKQAVPDMEIHISTQANTTNHVSALAWANLGASRVVLARELSFSEIKEIYEKVGDKVEIEAFVHGSMCIAYSGRCLMSAYMTDRSANRGQCVNACRFNYTLMEEKREGEHFPIIEDEDKRGSFILNSKDLCMIEYIPELVDAGIMSFKIEGRMKTPHYVATATKTYKEALTDYLADPALYESKKTQYFAELTKASNREFSTGFFLGKPDQTGQIYEGQGYAKTHDFVGVVRHYDEATQTATIEQRNKFSIGDSIEFLRGHGFPNFSQTIEWMKDEEGNVIQSAPHAQQIIKIRVDEPLRELDILRRKLD